MNDNLFNCLQQIVNEHGDDILNNPKRVHGLLADMAAREPKPEKKALDKCFEMGFYTELKNTDEPEQHKITFAKRLAYEEGFAPELCEGSVAIIAALVDALRPNTTGAAPVLPTEGENKILCRNCGKDVQNDWNLCPYCGAALGVEQQMSPPQYQSIQSQVSQNKKDDDGVDTWAVVSIIVMIFIVIIIAVIVT
jgi:hypothetical protein